jgi:hypothetical protein
VDALFGDIGLQDVPIAAGLAMANSAAGVACHKFVSSLIRLARKSSSCGRKPRTRSERRRPARGADRWRQCGENASPASLFVVGGLSAGLGGREL